LLLIVNIDTALKKFIPQEIDTNKSKNGISKLSYYYFLNSLLTIIILYLAYKYRWHIQQTQNNTKLLRVNHYNYRKFLISIQNNL